MMNNLFSSLRQSFTRLTTQERPLDPDHPTIVKSNPAYMLMGQTDLQWLAVRREDLPQSAKLPPSSFPFVFRAVKKDVTVHTGTITRGGRNIAYFHLSRGDGHATVTYIPQELLLQIPDAQAIPAIRSLMTAAA